MQGPGQSKFVGAKRSSEDCVIIRADLLPDGPGTLQHPYVRMMAEACTIVRKGHRLEPCFPSPLYGGRMEEMEP